MPSKEAKFRYKKTSPSAAQFPSSLVQSEYGPEVKYLCSPNNYNTEECSKGIIEGGDRSSKRLPTRIFYGDS